MSRRSGLGILKATGAAGKQDCWLASRTATARQSSCLGFRSSGAITRCSWDDASGSESPETGRPPSVTSTGVDSVSKLELNVGEPALEISPSQAAELFAIILGVE